MLCPYCLSECFFDGLEICCDCTSFRDPVYGDSFPFHISGVLPPLDEVMDDADEPTDIKRFSPQRSQSSTSRTSPSYNNLPTTSQTTSECTLDEQWTDNSPLRSDYPQPFVPSEADNYLSLGLREIENALSFHFSGRQFPNHVALRAKDIFRKSYEIQLQQKVGDLAFKKQKRSVTNPSSNRVRYGRRKAFVVTSVIVALKEFGVSLPGRPTDKETTAMLNKSIPGNLTIKLSSVKTCCRDLGLEDIRFR
jgi:hypothetical protein